MREKEHAEDGVEHNLLAKVTRRGSPQPLPGFAVACIRLGRELVSVGGERRSVVLVVPDRTYVALFVALGAVAESLAGAALGLDEPSAGDLVMVMHQNKMYEGNYEGTAWETVLGEVVEYVCIRVARGNLKFPRASCRIVSIGKDKEGTKLKKSKGFTPTNVPAEQLHAANLMGATDVAHFLEDTSPVVALIGTKQHLEEEARQPLFCHRRDDATMLSLQDLLRIDSMTRHKGHRVKLIPSVRPDGQPVASSLVVLDGCGAFINTGADISAGPQAILLQASDPAFDLARGQVDTLAQFSIRDNDWAPMNDPALASAERLVLRA